MVIGQTPSTLMVPPGAEVTRIGARHRWPIAWGRDLRRLLSRSRPHLFYMWGMPVSVLAAGRRDRLPAAAMLCDPAEARHCGQWYRRAWRPDLAIDLLCSSQTVQRRLVESGIPIDATVVIRPGVDFGAIHQAKEATRRAEIGLPPQGRVLLMPSPPSRAGGQYYGIWAAAILRQIWPDLSMIVPGTSREQQRLHRFVEQLYCPEIYHLTGDRYPPAQLLAVSDMMIVPAVDDTPTGWVAWAMAASVPVVGSATPSVTELLADRHTGFLCRPAEPHTLATRIRTAADSSDALRQCVAAARARAFELFAPPRCVRDHLEVINNLLAGRPAGEGIQDAALRA